MTQRMESYNKGLAKEMNSCSHTLAILFEYAWNKARRSLEAGTKEPRRSLEGGKKQARRSLEGAWKEARRSLEYAYSMVAVWPQRRFLIPLLLLTLGCGGVYAQTKVSDGIYYIQNNNSLSYGYLWPSLTTNTTTGYRYLTTSLETTAAAVNNNNGVSYSFHDKSYSHWVVKNVTGGYIQLINPRLNKYVVIREFPKANNTKQNEYGDRDVWLTDEPAAEDIDYSYFVLNNNSSPYKISPKPGLNDVANTSGYSFNSASGNSDRKWLTWSKTDNKPQNGEGREGLIQFYSGGTPEWSFTSDLLDAPTISDVNQNKSTVTVSDVNELPDGYNIRYTTNGDTPTATSTIMEDRSFTVTSSLTLKAIVERYGVVLTAVATKALEPAPCATPVITFDNTTSEVSITCATDESTIYYTTDGSVPTTSSTGYSGPFSVTSPTTVKAIATHAIFATSSVAELAIAQVATPTIQNNGSNAISITTTTPDANIYYTTDGSTPTPSSTKYTDPLTEDVSNVTIKAIAVKENMITSAVGSGTVTLQCATPVITRDGMTFTISCSFPTDANLYYTLDGGSEVTYTGTPVSFTTNQLPMTVTAIARHNDYTESETASFELINGTGTADDPYLIYGTTDFTNFVTNVNNGTTSSACYKLETDVSASNMDAITTAFTGTFDGGMHTISNLGHALFNTVNDGVVKNVILDNVSVSSTVTFQVGTDDKTAIGAIAGVATGTTRIYNCGILATNSTKQTNNDGYTEITSCSSSVGGTANYVGGLVGFLDGEARVINCFSYANITGGTEVGGIVGHNNVATTSNNLKTMVMNCMFYGDIAASCSDKAPIYNGTIISNAGSTGVGNYNYFYSEASYAEKLDIQHPNCALMAEGRFLQRFEFFRHLLNSHRELAGWWATGTYSKDDMAKWVLEPSQIGTATPYPILKKPGRYHSVVNIDNLDVVNKKSNTIGTTTGTLTVNIQMGNGAVYNHPGTGDSEAKITTPQLTLNITDKDPDHFNYNYKKVQLPYYNDVGTKNYTGYRVVTGWKIVSITGGTPGSFTSGADVTYNESGEIATMPYNFADRNCTNKDLYSVSGRVFSQGAYWDVPEGVSTITIEPYWAKCAYLADQNADKVYNTDMSSETNVSNVGGGQIYTNGTSYPIANDNQVVFTDRGKAIASDNSGLFDGVTGSPSSQTVYDYAVVLVGNYHIYANPDANKSKPYTFTSIDLDGDNEPDYSYIMRFDKRQGVHPVRVDFINIPGLGMAQKSTGSTGSYNFGILQPKYFFESTNTSLFYVTQFEYDAGRDVEQPYIVQGGVFDQWVGGQGEHKNKVTYFHVGGNVWFKEFHRGTHQDKTWQTKHPPVSVTGGDYDEFYLTGLYRGDVKNFEDNAECYINGGQFGIVCGAAMEGIGKANGAGNTGNITWQIQNADIKEFYAGGLNAAKPVTGNLSTTITGGYIGVYCGGPKFGDMSSGKTVTTTANNCTFGTFFGAGYGGNSYARQAPRNHNSIVNFPHKDNEGAGDHSSWNDWIDDYYTQEYSSTYGGVSTQFNYQFLPMSDNKTNVARIFVEYVKFSLATTKNVTSTLTGCTINNNFYGGGSLGKVDGNVTSTLTNCTVKGNVYGAGFSADLPKVEVDAIGFEENKEPWYYTAFGTYRKGVKGETTTYTWESANTISVDNDNHILYTTENIAKSNLGSVAGNVTLTITGNSVIGTDGDISGKKGNVYGGGESSYVTGNTHKVTVNLQGNTEVLGNVFGGGDNGVVEGSAEVVIKE